LKFMIQNKLFYRFPSATLSEHESFSVERNNVQYVQHSRFRSNLFYCSDNVDLAKRDALFLLLLIVSFVLPWKFYMKRSAR
jgi:hypothetical protein